MVVLLLATVVSGALYLLDKVKLDKAVLAVAIITAIAGILALLKK